MFIIAGLGNPGREYAGTRHNIGFAVIDALADKYNISITEKKHKALCGTGIIEGKKVLLVKPQTYMNNSGLSAIELASFFKIKPEEILVVHDELEMALGFVSLKFSGGLGGHNGLRSMKSVFNTPDFWRLRFGLSKPSGVDIADYVLSPFSQDERIVLDSVFTQTHNLFAEILLSSSPEKLLQNWSKKKLCEL